MWVRLEATEIDRLKQWVSVIQQMNPRYARLRVWDLLDAMDKLAAEPWYYEHQQYKVVVLFQYNRRFRRWHLEHLGFVGSTTPSEVLDLIIEMGATFLQTHGVDSIFTIRPTVVEFEPLRQLRDAADTHADLQMTVVREYELAKLLEIHYIGAPIVGTE